MSGRKSLLIIVGNLAGAFAGLLGLFAVGRYMTPASFGMFAFALSIASLAVLVARMGLESAHVKRIAEGGDIGDCVATYTRLKLVLVAGYAVALALGGYLWEQTVGFTDTTYSILLLAILYTAAGELRFIPVTTFNALRQTARAQVTMVVDHAARTPLVVLTALGAGAAAGRWTPFGEIAQPIAERLAWLAAPSGGALALGVAYAVGMALSLIMGIRLLSRKEYGRGNYRSELARAYILFALPLTLMSAASQISNQMDKVMLGFFWEADDVGRYFAMQRLVSFVLMVPGAVGTLLFPMLTELTRSGVAEGVRAMAHSTQRILSLVMVFLATLLITFASEGIHIFLSDAYLSGAPILRLLALQALLFGFSIVASTILLGYEKPGLVAWGGLIALVLNAVLNLVLIPTSIFGVPLAGLGGIGAAAATVVSGIASMTFLVVAAHRQVGGSYQPAAFVKHAVAAVSMWATIHALRPTPVLGGMDRWWELVGAGVLAAAVYAAVLVILREITRKDWLLVLDIAHPGKMVAYVRDELRKP